MTVTVAALKRALVELYDTPCADLGPRAIEIADAAQVISNDPTALTILAERLSVCTNEAVAKARAAAERSAMDFPRKDSWT